VGGSEVESGEHGRVQSGVRARGEAEGETMGGCSGGGDIGCWSLSASRDSECIAPSAGSVAVIELAVKLDRETMDGERESELMDPRELPS